MITRHKWNCKDCDMQLFVVVDDRIESHLARFERFNAFVSKHCIENQHEVTHKEKKDLKVKYV